MKPKVMLIALALASFSTAVCANDYKLGALEIHQPWARATPKGAKTAAGYVEIKNTGTTPDRLTGGSLAVAGAAQVHEMTMGGGVMRMRPVPDGIEIKPGETLELKPEGFHLMFTDLNARLVKGQSVKGTLTFANAGTVDVEFAIEGMGATSAGAGDHMHMDHMQMDHMQMH
jgi:periplasmic copper chaperone A